MPRLLSEGLQITLPQPGLIFVAAGLLFGLSIFRAIVAFGQRYFGERLSQHISYDMRNEVYDKVQRLPFIYHDHSQMGQTIHRKGAIRQPALHLFSPLTAWRFGSKRSTCCCAVCLMVHCCQPGARATPGNKEGRRWRRLPRRR